MNVSRRRLPWLRIAGLAVVWVLFWGDLSLANLISGLLLGLLVSVVFPLPSIEFHGRFRPLAHAWLIMNLLWDLVRSSFVVAAQAFRFGRRMKNAVVRVELRSRSDLYLTLTTELVSLVPGTLVLEARRREGVVYVHVMDVRSEADLVQARRDVRDAEARVLRAFGSDEEVAELAAEGSAPAGPGEPAVSAAGVIIAIGVVILGLAASLTLVRMARGPSTLDRVVAADVIVAVVIAGLAMEAALHHHATTLPIMVVLSMLGFAGSLSMARFVADRDQARTWEQTEQESR